MVLQLTGRTAITVTRNTGGLLPRLFTLIRLKTNGYFLLRYHTLTSIFPLGRAMPFVARTFLSPAKGER